MPDNGLSSLRKQLLANGYFPLPGVDRSCKIKGWNGDFLKREIERQGSLDAAIDSWDQRFPENRTTNVLIRDRLVAIDGDVDDLGLAERLIDVIQKHAPEVLDRAPARYGSGEYKVTWFARLAEADKLFVRHGSRKYARPDELAAWHADKSGPKPAYHHVEVFGGARFRNGNFSRQFGAFGPHTRAKSGKRAIFYSWAEGGTLADIPLVDLPVITDAQIWAILHGFEELATEDGWEALPESTAGGEGGKVLYDIDRGTTKFETRDHGTIGYAELEALVHDGEDVRLWATFIPGEAGVTERADRCEAMTSSKYGCVMVYDHKLANTHLPTDLEPKGPIKAVAEMLKRIAEGQAPELDPDPDDDPPKEPEFDAELEEKVMWLLATYGFYAAEDAVVGLYATSLDCRLKPSAFERRFKSWYSLVAKSKSVSAEVHVTQIWERAPMRKHLAGVRMRPDRTFPLYWEAGALFKNTYRRPTYAAGGVIEPFLEFMGRFLPDAREREWLYDWMAHKWRRPEIPGTAVVFVADSEDGVREGVFGTGRGFMFRIARALYGHDYARAQSFSMIEGSSGQAVFNDWIHGSVLVTVDESRTSATAYRRGERSATYEILKDIVDPAPKLFHFRGKYRAAFDGWSYCSFWVATNHADALAIPATDRRFSVLRNGRKMTLEERQAIVAWLDKPENIGALAAFLKDRDLTGFDMYSPLETVAKTDMAELALSSVDEVMLDLMADETKGLVFTRKHFEAVFASNFNVQDTYWRGELKGAWNRYCVGPKTDTGSHRRVRTEGTKRKLYCFRTNLVAVQRMPEAALRREAGKWGHIEGLRDPIGVPPGVVGSQDKDE